MWSWCCHWVDELQGKHGINDAWLSALLPQATIVRHRHTRTTSLSLGGSFRSEAMLMQNSLGFSGPVLYFFHLHHQRKQQTSVGFWNTLRLSVTSHRFLPDPNHKSLTSVVGYFSDYFGSGFVRPSSFAGKVVLYRLAHQVPVPRCCFGVWWTSMRVAHHGGLMSIHRLI
jgi:hypothetical protein